jgi:pectin methylesterase-like acyl-CoA thioesterase
MNRVQPRLWSIFVCCLLFIVARPAAANTPCVNSGGSGGCYKSIQDAVNNASPGDILKVAKGTYKGSVVIGTSSISLIVAGAGSSQVVTPPREPGVPPRTGQYLWAIDA